MEDSILKSTKKILGVGPDFTSFDLDILTHINSALSVVNQIGVIEPVTIEDDGPVWADFELPADQLGMLKTFVFLHVQMLFDPPTLSFVIDAKERQLEEHLVRLSMLRENALADD